MKKAIYILMLAVMAAPLGAVHGPMASLDRDAWIDASLSRLVETGWLPAPEKPFADFTNREAAEAVARASERLLAAAATKATDAEKPIAGTAEMQKLVKEFRAELKKMELDVAAVEAEFSRLRANHRTLEDLLEPLAHKTGTEARGYSRGYLSTVRGMGPDSGRPSLVRHGANFIGLKLKSVPAPFVLFEMDLRMWGSLGYIYAEPISPTFEFRQLSLTAASRGVVFTGGDFFKSYSPLVLWNTSPVHNLIEPTSFQRRRTDLEEILLMDRGPAWHLRGMDLGASRVWKEGKYLDRVSAEGMAGPIEPARETSFASFFAGGRAGFSALRDRASLHGNALLLWDDETTAPIAYDPAIPSTHGQRLRVVSLQPSMGATVVSDVTVKLTGEVAVSRYLDNTRNETSRIEGRALRVAGVAASHGVSLAASFRETGTDFLSPGAQTLRRTPLGTTDGYESVNESKDEGLIGLRDRFLFQTMGRPSFAAYDRITEMILPYGDSTPNRIGPTVGVLAALGKDGWVKPQVHYSSVREVSPVWVRDSSGVLWAVDSGAAKAVERRLTGIEGALEMSLSQPLPKTGLKYFGGSYKSQESEFAGIGLKVDTITLGLDGTPPLSFLGWMQVSLGFQRVTAQGTDFALSSSRPGQSLAAHHSILDSMSLGTYELRVLDLKRTVLAAGVKYAITNTFSVRGDWFGTTDRLGDRPDYDDRTNEWRLTYEASF